MTSDDASPFAAYARNYGGGSPVFTADKKALLRALGHVQSVVEKRGALPVLANVKISAAEGKVLFTATDLDMCISETTEASVTQSGECTAPAHLLYEIVRKLPGDSVTMEADNGRETLRVAAGSCHFSLPVTPADAFPAMTPDEETRRFAVDAGDLASLIDKTRFAISSEETRFYLNGLYLCFEEREGEGRVVAVSTDGHRLAKAEIAAPEDAKDMRTAIIPRKTVFEIRKILEENTGEVVLSLSRGKVAFIYGAGMLISKLLEGVFPDYRSAMPQGEGTRFSVAAKPLAEAVDRVATVTTDKVRSVRFSLSAGSLRLAARSGANSLAEEEMPADYEGCDVELVFNSRYLLDMLSAVEGDQVGFRFADPGGVVVASDAASEGAMFMIMPMRG